MKYFILTARQTTCTAITSFAAMKVDYDELSINQKLDLMLHMLQGISISQEYKDKLAAFARCTNAQKFELGTFQIIRKDYGNMYEFQLVQITEVYPAIRAVEEEDYQHYVEDAKDEATK